MSEITVEVLAALNILIFGLFLGAGAMAYFNGNWRL